MKSMEGQTQHMLAESPDELVHKLATYTVVFWEISESWLFGDMACRRLGFWGLCLSVMWYVSKLECRRVGLLASWHVG